MNVVAILLIAGSLVSPVGMVRVGQNGTTGVGPTEENAVAAEKEVTQALLTNDGDALGRLLADDWIVVSTQGAIADRKSFIGAIKSGLFARKTMDLSDFRVKIYGNTAVVTTQLKTSGTLGGKDFDVTERQTDVLVWSDGAWKSVLLHETKFPK
jgi:ketosteroid isomerase-like protein